jgi:hypothetical protein
MSKTDKKTCHNGSRLNNGYLEGYPDNAKRFSARIEDKNTNYSPTEEYEFAQKERKKKEQNI